MVGAVGRTDLLGPEPREQLARRLYRALHDEVLTLPDELPVYPTHGAGCFCSAPGAAERTTTIGRERATNSLLRTPDEDTFVTELLAGFGTFPGYFSRLPELNRRGPRLYGELPALARISVDDAVVALQQGALVVDARGITAFAAGHSRGALSIELRPIFASWLGWIVNPDRPLIFVVDDDQDRADLVRQCLTVGYEHLLGEIDGGFAGWRDAGQTIATIELIDVGDLTRSGTVLDVRQHNEYASGHIGGAVNIELGSLSETSVPDGPLTVMCGHGERAMTAASILHQRGDRDVAVLAGGPGDWSARTGHPLSTGP